MRTAIGIPERESGVLLFTLGYTCSGINRRSVFAVDVAEEVRLYHCVIQGRIEDSGLLPLIVHVDGSEAIVPRLACVRCYLVEAAAFGLLFQVGHSALGRNGRDSHLNHHRPGRRSEREVGTQLAAVDYIGTRTHRRAVGKHGFERTRELCREINLAELRPPGNHAVAGEHRGRHHAQLRLDNLAVPAPLLRRALEVHDDVGHAVGRECIAMYSHARGGRHLRQNILVVEIDAVVAGRSSLALM